VALDVVPGDLETLAFADVRDFVNGVLTFSAGGEAAGLSHGDLEVRLQVDAREFARLTLQGHLSLRAQREIRQASVVDAANMARNRAEPGHERGLATLFGAVDFSRIAYRIPGRENLHPADAALNLPTEKHSHGLRRLAAVEATRGSFDEAVEAIKRATGQKIGKRQVVELAKRGAVDFDDFYAQRKQGAGDPGDIVVLSCDGKGVVMRHDALRPVTAAAAAKSSLKLATRLSKGEKRNRKRMAELGTVYEATPATRSVADILPADDEQRRDAAPGPVTTRKWLTASVIDDPACVVRQVFDEAHRRDPDHARAWVALVDGNNHQIGCIGAEAKARGIDVSIVIDFIHVLEYLWKATWSFHKEGDSAAEIWVRRHATAVLEGEATRVAGAIRRAATTAGLELSKRAGADACATYLTNKAPYLDYPKALKEGWPIATGVIEGACRHLVKDRMDVTGARWGLVGAEAVLKLRALRSNGDFDAYWRFHQAEEHQRVHRTRYANGVIPKAA
jgi:hypothetical protein